MAAFDKLQFRRGTAAEWAAVNPVLLAGEPGVETDTGVVKVGDGSTAWADLTALGGGSGAPTDADYLVGTTNGDLSAEIVVGTSPGGELGGTWGSPTVDATHAGSAHHDAVTVGTGLDISGQAIDLSLDEVAAGGELSGFMDAPTVDATHAGSTHSAATDTHIADTTDVHDHGSLSGLADDDHTQYATNTEFDDHSARHEDGGADEISLTGLSGTPADLTTHAGAADPHTGYRLESADHTHASTGAQAGQITVSALSDSPAGELGGTWASPTVDATHSGSTHAATQAAAEATAASALTTHEGDTSTHGVAEVAGIADVTFETLDAAGDVGTSASTLAEGDHTHAGAGHTIQDDNSGMTQRANLSFQDGFVVTDDAGGGQTEIDVSYGAAGYPLDIADSESDGTAITVARSDHVHSGAAYLKESVLSEANVTDLTDGGATTLHTHAGISVTTTSSGAAPATVAANSAAAPSETWLLNTADNAVTTVETVMSVTSVPAGTYLFEYYLVWRSGTTTVGCAFTVDYTGTVTRVRATRHYQSTGAAAATGVADGTSVVLTGTLVEHMSAIADNSPLGPNTGVGSTSEDQFDHIRGIIVVSDQANLNLSMTGEGNGAVTFKADSFLRLTRIA